MKLYKLRKKNNMLKINKILNSKILFFFQYSNLTKQDKLDLNKKIFDNNLSIKFLPVKLIQKFIKLSNTNYNLKNIFNGPLLIIYSSEDKEYSILLKELNFNFLYLFGMKYNNNFLNKADLDSMSKNEYKKLIKLLL